MSRPAFRRRTRSARQPDASDRRALLVYDGDCGFCTASARWIGASPSADLRAAAGRDLDPKTVASWGLSQTDLAAAAWLVEADGRLLRGHRAIARALALSGGWRRPLGLALGAPPLVWLGRPGYALVARIRHRLPPGRGSCPLPR